MEQARIEHAPNGSLLTYIANADAMVNNLRNETNLQTLQARSQQYYNSFLPSTTRIWNSLPDDTKNSPSVESFKHKLNNNITKPPPYYFSGSRLGQIYHARIRLNCLLRYHLFQKNIIDYPECECCEIENTSHYFFFHCNLYGQLRHSLLDRVSTYCQPTVNVFLYGNTDLTAVENAELFSAVQDNILKQNVSAKEQKYTFENSYNRCTHN